MRMSRLLLVTFPAAVLLAACLATPPASAAPAAPTALTPPTARTVFSTGSQVVASLAVAKDGRVFYVGPASGKIFVWSPKTRKTSTFATVPRGSAGYGVTLSPTFGADHLLYAYVTVGPHEQLVRFTDTGGVGKGFAMLRDVGAIGSEHTGGKILFSPNAKNLFLIVGDGGNPANSQNPRIDHGKILRLTPNGTPAPGNPGYPDRAIWATGFRNSIGMAFDPQTQHMWEAENGPECNDEINSISGGKNFGWGPSEVCDGTVAGTNQDGVAPVLPAEAINPVVAPTGMTFCAACGVPVANGKMVYGRYKTSDLRVVTLDAARKVIVSDDLLYQDTDKVIAVESSPADHSIWFSDQANRVLRLG